MSPRAKAVWLLALAVSGSAALAAGPAKGPTARFSKQEVERAVQRAKAGTRPTVGPAVARPDVLTMWVLLRRLTKEDDALLCAVQQAAARANGALSVHILVGRSASSKFVVEGSCLKRVGAFPITSGEVSRYWSGGVGLEPMVTVLYQGKRSTKPLSLWRSALADLR